MGWTSQVEGNNTSEHSIQDYAPASIFTYADVFLPENNLFRCDPDAAVTCKPPSRRG